MTHDIPRFATPDGGLTWKSTGTHGGRSLHSAWAEPPRCGERHEFHDGQSVVCGLDLGHGGMHFEVLDGKPTGRSWLGEVPESMRRQVDFDTSPEGPSAVWFVKREDYLRVESEMHGLRAEVAELRGRNLRLAAALGERGRDFWFVRIADILPALDGDEAALARIREGTSP